MPDTDLRAARIAALAGVAGALVGGAASYFGNLQLYRSERTDLTRGTARVLQQDLETAARQWISYWQGNLNDFPPEFSVEVDRAELTALATQMSADEWEKVALAQAAVQYVESRLDGNRRLPCYWRSVSAAQAGFIIRGAAALNEPADTAYDRAEPKADITAPEDDATRCTETAKQD